MFKKYVILTGLLFTAISFSQSRFNLPRKDSDKIRFQLIDNLIIVPVEVNGIKLSFLLDSGVSKPILFNITNTDSLQINNVETIYLRGLGGGEPIEALKSKRNFFKIGNALNVNQDIYVVFDNAINFTPRLGVPVHGIIGYDVFKDFIVDINYTSKYLKLYKPDKYVYKDCKKCETFNLTFFNNKPYIDGEVKIESKLIPIKLLIDSGSGDALWLFEDDELGIIPHEDKYFVDFLGKGLSGSVYGKRSKVNSLKLKSFELKDVNAAFPDSIAISYARKHKKRNGSLSGEILKRFNMIVDYGNAKLTLRKNRNFKSSFYYNKSGIVLEQNGVRIVKEEQGYVERSKEGASTGTTINVVTLYKYALKPAYTIVELRKDSPAEKAGLLIGDIIIVINGKEAHMSSLQEINQMFRAENGKNIRIKVDRNGVITNHQFRLEDVFKQKELP
ncbi:retropepsin-like aspartic protease [Ichthyenterobacterium magnum]|uniref:Aspartyl protease n=1 Tax=Ichthyenterobacterium magnum TaxID=1230530 RepID=A0A420DVL6_9FLAO|nr:aspartyl protease family protein [Ichthyenterobacterium magnum]RKE98268.1 aspartyl protease [Ichthyenterobacterium magnum]